MYTMHTCLSADCVMHESLACIVNCIIFMLSALLNGFMDSNESEEDSVCSCRYIL